MNAKLLGAALVAALAALPLTVKGATANTISGVYSFSASSFWELTDDLHPRPLTEICG
jgi:hypothetical protein